MKNIKIVEVVECKSNYVKVINCLLTQLTPNASIFTKDDLNAIISSDSSHLFLLFYHEKVVGMLTIGHYKCPTGIKYWIEDVVVDKEYRGKRLGFALLEHAKDFVSAQQKGVLMLTSNPSRIAANNLYQNIGFEPRDTNVYRMIFEDDE